MYSIPNLDPLYREVVDYVKAHQGEKGYIDCQPYAEDAGDLIYGFVYDEEHRAGMEEFVYGVRVVTVDDAEGYHNEGDLEAIFEPFTPSCHVIYKPEDFKNEDAWMSVRWSDVVYYIPTLYSIAESIEEYA
jgi:hypothetical protein